MKERDIPQPITVLVCTHGGGGKKCHGGKKLCAQLKRRIKQQKLKGQVQVLATGCMDQCSKGPNIMVLPQNAWYSRVRDRDLDGLLDGLLPPSAHAEEE